MPAPRKAMTFRFLETDFEEIDRRAQQRNMTRTDYIIKAALGKLDTDNHDETAWKEQVEKRLAGLEEFCFGGPQV